MTVPDIALPEFARTIGAGIDRWEDGRPVLAVDYGAALCGNPGMFHGGVVAALLEMAAVSTLAAQLHGSPSRASPVGTTVAYLRPAVERPAFAAARIVRAGRSSANLQATLWQESEDKPVATATVNFRISQGSGE
jgi:uncharacterized protein (TIGR00369 family)